MRPIEITVVRPTTPWGRPVEPAPPPITWLPEGTNVLGRYSTTGVRPWGAEPMDLPVGLTVAFWALGCANVVLGGWLVAVLLGAFSGSGWAFSVATLGGHPLPTLGLAVIDVLAVAGAAGFTRGLSRAGAVPLAVSIVGALCGAVALAGAVALLVLTALVLGTGVAVVVLVLERA